MIEGVENAEIITDHSWIEELDLPEGAEALETIHIVLVSLPDGQTGVRVNRQGRADLLQQLGLVRMAEEVLVKEWGG
jgi:hypothetical protein